MTSMTAESAATPGFEDEVFAETTDSTMEMAKRAIDRGEVCDGVSVFRAGEQTKGRGSKGRLWKSPKGNVYATLTVPLSRIASLGTLPLAVGIAVHQALSSFVSAPRLFLKWPNDVIDTEGRKLCGSIIEIHGSFVLVGVGINVAEAPEITDAGGRPSVCLAQLVPTCPTPKDVTQALRRKLCSLLDSRLGDADLSREWSALADWNKTVTRRDMPGVQLRPVALTAQGHLRVQLPDRTEETLVDQYLV